jgi:N6-adenosine-specific RNA methylase IME4
MILADNPWSFDDRVSNMKSKTKRSAHDQYDGKTLTIEQMAALPVKALAAKNCVMAFWVTGSHIFEAPKVFEAWGFDYKQLGCWGKLYDNPEQKIRDGKTMNDLPNMGMGRLFRQSQELWLMCVRGNVYPMLENKGQRSLILAPLPGKHGERHSSKPEELQDRLEIMFPKARKLELFARRSRPGWTCVGNAIDGLDIREALARLRGGSAPAMGVSALGGNARLAQVLLSSNGDGIVTL